MYVNTRKYYETQKDSIPDKILKIDMSSGTIMETHTVPYSQFSHDMIKVGDNAYLADTGHGYVWKIGVSNFQPVEKLTMFRREDHVNNLAYNSDMLYVMMHSRGVSGLGIVDLNTKETIVLRGVGTQAHQIVFIGNKQILYLDSGLPALKLLDLATFKVYKLFEVHEEPRKFLKGLFVRNNVAYFGSTVAGSRQWRRDVDNDATIIAFDLKTFKVLSERKLDTDGIVNTISQSFKSDSSCFVAANTDLVVPNDGSMVVAMSLTIEQRQGPTDGSVPVLAEKIKSAAASGSHKADDTVGMGQLVDGGGAKFAKQVAEKLGVDGKPSKEVVVYDKSGRDFSEVTMDNLVGGEWPSGMKFIDLRWKSQDRNLDLTSKVDRAEDVQLIMGDLNGGHLLMRQMLLDLPLNQWEYKHQVGNAFLSERDGVMNKFKPGVRDIKFVFSDIDAQNSYWFPWYFKFEKALKPIIDKVLGENMTHHIARMQLARMADSAEIKPHVDSGGWPSKLHRIHVPIIVPSGTVFSVVGRQGASDSYKIRLVEGEVFEINNRVLHWVKNPSHQRIHLLIDARERPYDPKWLAPGQSCKYMRSIICDEPTITREKAYELYTKAINS